MADTKIEVRIDDHTDELKQKMAQRLPVLLKSLGVTAQKYARDLCPVDTSTLKNSISHRVAKDESAVYIGTNVKYGVYVEFGDYNHKVGQKHFLRSAITYHEDHYKEMIEAFWKSLED